MNSFPKLSLALIICTLIAATTSLLATDVVKLHPGNLGPEYSIRDKDVTHPVTIILNSPIPDGNYEITLQLQDPHFGNWQPPVDFSVTSGQITTASYPSIDPEFYAEGYDGGTHWVSALSMTGSGNNVEGSVTDTLTSRDAVSWDDWNAFAASYTAVTEPLVVNVYPAQPPPDPKDTKPYDLTVGGDGSDTNCSGIGMARYSAHELLASLHIVDTPLTYRAAFGPTPVARFTYNQKQVGQPAQFTFSHVGQKWNFEWVSYVEDDPNNSSANATVYVPGGGSEVCSGFNSATQSYAPEAQSMAQLVRTTSSTYERRFPDGSKMVYGVSDGATTAPRRIFLSQVVDPSGQTLTLGYGQAHPTRLETLTDVTGKVTTLLYGSASDAYQITGVMDPYGRSCSIAYYASGLLHTITDSVGITSQMTYSGTTDFVNSLTTPYGTSTFTSGTSTGQQWLEMVDAKGGKERVEYRDSCAKLSGMDTAAPSGWAVSNDLLLRNSFFFTKKAMMEIGMSTLDYRKAVITHWLKSADSSATSGIPASQKAPLENRVWYQYAGQPDVNHAGSSDRPTKIGRLLDDSSTQLSQFEYNSLGKPTKATDPLGRSTSYVYDSATGMDLTQVLQTTGSMSDVLATYGSYVNHQPQQITDASGQLTQIAYNAHGQPDTLTNANGEVTKFIYNTGTSGFGKVQSVTRAYGTALSATTSYIYDSYGRVHISTDSDGYTLTYDYDAIGGDPLKSLDRLAKITYPDSTSESIIYNVLDPEWTYDRLGRGTHILHDALQHVTSVTDPELRTTQYVWCNCGALDQIIDANNNVTQWTRDLEQRITGKTIAGSPVATYAYENATSRLHSVTDALSQAATYGYNADNDLASVTYTGAQKPTDNLSYAYESNYNRLHSITSGTSDTLTYTYNPITTGSSGAGRLSSVSDSFTGSTTSYSYDALGRLSGRSIDGAANSSTIGFDALGRVNALSNALGAFSPVYIGNSARLDYVDYPQHLRVDFDYFSNSSDKRLSEIKNLDRITSGVISQFDYSYDSAGRITQWTQANSGLSAARVGTPAYDGADQLKAFEVKDATSGLPVHEYAYGYDAAGNRTSAQADGDINSFVPNAYNQLASQSPGGQMLFKGTVSEPSTVTLSGSAATVSGTNWSGYAPVVNGSNSISITATELDVSPGNNAQTFSYDACKQYLNWSCSCEPVFSPFSFARCRLPAISALKPTGHATIRIERRKLGFTKTFLAVN